MQGPPSDIQHELSHQHRKKPNLLHRSQGEPPTKPQPFISSRVFTTHPELGSDHFQGNCSENPREACHCTWLTASWHMWAVESERRARGCLWKDKTALYVRGYMMWIWQLLSPIYRTVPINNSDRDPRQPRVLGGGGAISRGEKGVESAPGVSSGASIRVSFILSCLIFQN